jgi:hypothetical protein
MISETLLDRNAEILRKELSTEMRNSLNIGNYYIDQELTGLSMLLRPIVKLFYNTLVKTDLEKGTLITINGIIKMTRQMIMDGVAIDSPEFDKRLEEKFPAYVKNDQTTRQCKTDHPNYQKCVDNLRNTFRWQIIPTYMMMSNEDPAIKDYPSLVISTFKTAEKSKEILRKQIDSMEYGLKIVESDLNIINISTAREVIMRVLRKGFDHKVRDFFNQIDDIYNGKKDNNTQQDEF